jgi:hypothetical protein
MPIWNSHAIIPYGIKKAKKKYGVFPGEQDPFSQAAGISGPFRTPGKKD